MYWICAVLLLGLILSSLWKHKVADQSCLRSAWHVFALIPVSQVIFSVVKGGQLRSPLKLAEAELWSSGIVWTLVAVCIYRLVEALAPAPLLEKSNFS